jgi:N-ethylmaleimide reductase
MLNANWSNKVKMGEFLLKNRICMAALTRQRCNPENGIPNDLLIEYYSQRIGASMILT